MQNVSILTKPPNPPRHYPIINERNTHYSQLYHSGFFIAADNQSTLVMHATHFCVSVRVCFIAQTRPTHTFTRGSKPQQHIQSPPQNIFHEHHRHSDVGPRQANAPQRWRCACVWRASIQSGSALFSHIHITLPLALARS